MDNVTFDSCRTEDFGIMNAPNVDLFMENCMIKDCKALYSDESKNARWFMLTDDNLDFESISIITNCKFRKNSADNGGAGLYIDRRKRRLL